MTSKSYHCTSILQLKQVLSEANTSAFQPTLAIVFCTMAFDLEEIRNCFVERQIALAGCSTAGEIIDDSLHEKSIAMMLMDLAPASFQIKLSVYQDKSMLQAAQEIGTFVGDCFSNPGVLLMSSGISIDAQQLVEGINSAVSKSIPIYGGLAGDDLALVETYAFTQDGMTENGAAILVFDTEKIAITGLALSGWKPIGGVNVITKAAGNVVLEINNEPALDVFVRYFGLSEAETKHDQLISIQTNYPFQLLRDDGKSILRSPILINKEMKSITLAASVSEGDRFRFSTSPGFEVIDQTVEGFQALKAAAPEADALVLFSCKGRHGAFGPLLKNEIKGIYQYWEKPLIGFLSYGEIGNIGDEDIEFHNETCVAVTLKER